jgi:hypothetical protein
MPETEPTLLSCLLLFEGETAREIGMPMDPVILSLRGILDRQSCEIESINALITFLRAHWAFNEVDFKSPEEAGLPAVLRKLQPALDRIGAPEPSFSVPRPLRIIGTVEKCAAPGRF